MPPATYALVLRPPRESDGLHPVALRITKDRTAKFANTGIYVAAKQWNDAPDFLKANWVKSNHSDHKLYNPRLKKLLKDAHDLVIKEPNLTAAQLRDRVTGKASADNPDALDFLGYLAKDLERHETAGNPRTAKKRRTILRKLTAHTEQLGGPGALLPFRALTVSWVKDYQSWLATEHGNSQHTANKELQVIHTIVKQAVADGYFPYEKDPFLHIRLKHPKTNKTRLTIAEVEQLEAVTPAAGWATLARDCWLLQFHCQGTRVGDILELRHRHVGPGRLTYPERKTGKTKNIPRHPRLDAVLARYPLAPGGDPNSFVLPILDHTQPYAQPLEQAPTQTEAQARFAKLLDVMEKQTVLINRFIKKVAAQAGIEKAASVTSHTARHSFADAARIMLNGDVLAIKNMLNHGQLRTTEIYLSDFTASELDTATLSVYNTGTTNAERPGTSLVQSAPDATKLPFAD